MRACISSRTATSSCFLYNAAEHLPLTVRTQPVQAPLLEGLLVHNEDRSAVSRTGRNHSRCAAAILNSRTKSGSCMMEAGTVMTP